MRVVPLANMLTQVAVEIIVVIRTVLLDLEDRARAPIGRKEQIQRFDSSVVSMTRVSIVSGGSDGPPPAAESSASAV